MAMDEQGLDIILGLWMSKVWIWYYGYGWVRFGYNITMDE